MPYRRAAAALAMLGALWPAALPGAERVIAVADCGGGFSLIRLPARRDPDDRHKTAGACHGIMPAERREPRRTA